MATWGMRRNPDSSANTMWAHGHREFHCHLAFDNVLEGFFEDRVATDQGRSDANYTDAGEWLPKSKPDRSRSEDYEGNANEFSPFNSPRVLFAIRDVFGRGQRIALGDELRGDGFAVALVHLATVGFDVNTGHSSKVAS